MGEANRLLGIPTTRDYCSSTPTIGCTKRSMTRSPSVRDGVVQSTSLMVPCPAPGGPCSFSQRTPPSLCVHLSVIRDMPPPLGSDHARERVASLLDEEGRFDSSERIPEMLAGPGWTNLNRVQGADGPCSRWTRTTTWMGTACIAEAEPTCRHGFELAREHDWRSASPSHPFSTRFRAWVCLLRP